MDPQLQRLYPDISAAGGLAIAMSTLAHLRGLAIGPVAASLHGIRIGTDRGTVTVSLAPEERLFLLGVHSPGFTWGTGSTGELGLLVDAVSAWCSGMSIDEFEAKFPFVRLDEFARALEVGDVTPQQWSQLLGSDFYAAHRSLLRRIHADERLRTLFPTFTHGELRLRVDPMDFESRQFLVDHLGEHRYQVTTVDELRTTRVTESLDDLIGCLRALLGGTD
ncbi:hypothetical protein [Streptomyces sp. NPDC051183]|uniref:hypothetical protein n=1 Tax=unclassified Streptomyces TaxID=2593676 RepID=UPI00343425A7